MQLKKSWTVQKQYQVLGKHVVPKIYGNYIVFVPKICDKSTTVHYHYHC